MVISCCPHAVVKFQFVFGAQFVPLDSSPDTHTQADVNSPLNIASHSIPLYEYSYDLHTNCALLRTH